MRTRRIIAVALVASFAVPAAAPTAHAGRDNERYTPPYKKGHESGDFANYTHADPQSGEVTVFRLYPFPGAFGCEGQGGQATLRVVHHVRSPVRRVDVRYDDAFVDPYTWITAVAVDGHGEWVGSRTVRGPEFGEGVLKVPLGKRSPGRGGTITVEFGIQVASACPNADGGSATFTSVTMRDG